MSLTTALLVALGAAVGAPARYFVDESLSRRVGGTFPWGTLLVNLGGSLVLGVLVGLGSRDAASDEVVTLAGTGFAGAFTTASAFGWEAVALAETGRWRRATAYVVVSLAGGVALAAAGYAVGAA